MADAGSIPFGNVIEYIRNKGDDDFESSFDETYGDPNSSRFDDGSTRTGFNVILLTAGFLFFLVLCRYGCFWFIDYVIMCDHRRNPRNQGLISRALSKCCPCWFSSTAPLEDSLDDPGRSSGNDDPTAANTSNHSNIGSDSDSSDDGSTELAVQRNQKYAKRLMRILSEEQKRSIFSSILKSRTATSADVLESRRGEEAQRQQSSSSVSENEELTLNESSISIPDGSPTNMDGNENNHACCPICIQDVKVGDKVYHCNHCLHFFHFDCLLEWVGTGSTLCPYCRHEIFTRRILEQAYEQHRSKKQPQTGV